MRSSITMYAFTCPRNNLRGHEILRLMRLAFGTLQPRENLILQTFIDI